MRHIRTHAISQAICIAIFISLHVLQIRDSEQRQQHTLDRAVYCYQTLQVHKIRFPDIQIAIFLYLYMRLHVRRICDSECRPEIQISIVISLPLRYRIQLAVRANSDSLRFETNSRRD